ncbi:hypothetical protein Tco_1210485, partial [Tanacetum coccineum]
DLATSKAIGSKSYNTLMGELVALETQYMASVSEKNPEEDCVDDVASTIESSKVPVTENDINVGGAPKETPSTISNGDSSSLVNNHNDDLIRFEADEESHDVSSSLESDKEGHDGQMNASVSDQHESKDGSEKLNIEVPTTGNISHNLSGSDSLPSVDQSAWNESSNDLPQTIAESDSLASTADGNELVAGEKCISETNTLGNEGEAVMSEKVDKDSSSADDTSPKDETNARQGELIRDFLKSSASQLTIYGLKAEKDESMSASFLITVGDEKNATRTQQHALFGNRKLARRKVKECSKIGREHTKKGKTTIAKEKSFVFCSKSASKSRQARVGKQETASKSRQARVGKQESASKRRQARVVKQESASKSRQARIDKQESISKNEIKA